MDYLVDALEHGYRVPGLSGIEAGHSGRFRPRDSDGTKAHFPQYRGALSWVRVSLFHHTLSWLLRPSRIRLNMAEGTCVPRLMDFAAQRATPRYRGRMNTPAVRLRQAGRPGRTDQAAPAFGDRARALAFARCSVRRWHLGSFGLSAERSIAEAETSATRETDASSRSINLLSSVRSRTGQMVAATQVGEIVN
jgi:hypothetical protein